MVANGQLVTAAQSPCSGFVDIGLVDETTPGCDSGRPADALPEDVPKLRVSGVTHDSIVDGPGLRYVVFTQGCHLACRGCHNPATQPLDAGQVMPVSQLIQDMASNSLTTGLTLSGGEPSLQAEACALLAEAAQTQGLDVWCYSGYRMEVLLRRATQEAGLRRLLAAVDVLVDGAFVVAKRSLTLPWRGSTNQRLIDVPGTLVNGTITEWVADTNQ